ncbi:MAG: thiol peroxidase [Spirochaetia bacterium]|jgi:thiol peroxidase|nr:thiol peroxidase [Spirochaetia bacterium]
MAVISLKGNKVNTSGSLPASGTKAPDFTLTGSDLGDVKLSDFKGKTVVLNIFPSIDTSVCAASVRKFNEIAGTKKGAAVLCISRDLPFAHERFCSAEGLKNVTTLSEMKALSFGEKYGLRIADGPLQGLLARAVVVIDPEGKVKYTQLVPEITTEPDYDSALKVL